MDAHKASNVGGTRKANLRDYITENEMYESVVDQINQKLALRQAIDRANDAIAQSKRGGSQMGDDCSQFSKPSIAPSQRLPDVGADARSKVSENSKLSLHRLSQRVA